MENNIENNSGKSLRIKDIVTVAIMLALFLAISALIGMSTIAVPFVYLYVAPGLELFLGAIFFLVAANRINKRGLLFIWVTLYGILTAAVGYFFMLPYFLVVAIICELSMIGKDTYRNPLRNMIGWSLYGAGMFIGIAIPCWVAWESFQKQALESGFAAETLQMQYEVVYTPILFITGIAVTVVLSALGVLFAQKILKKHFKKSGIIN